MWKKATKTEFGSLFRPKENVGQRSCRMHEDQRKPKLQQIENTKKKLWPLW
jgi:hypothetical protein